MNNISILNQQINCRVRQISKPRKQKNAIAFCVDEGYLPFAIFVARQLIEKEDTDAFDICICLPSFNLLSADMLALPVRFVEIEVSGVDNLPVDHLSLAAYHRIFLPNIFEDCYEYIVYLDADVYIRKPFFNDLMNFVSEFRSDFCVAAAPDITEINRRLKLKNSVTKVVANYLQHYHVNQHTYRNSGVLVFSVRNCVKRNLADKVFEAAFNPESNLRCHDQSALNLALVGEMPVLPFEYNWQLHENNYRLIEKRDAYIVHFISTNKPWVSQYVFTQPYITEYKQFLKTYFPKHQFKLKTPYQIRLSKPKYQNKLRETISRVMSQLRSPFTRVVREIKFSTKRNDVVNQAIDAVNEKLR